VAVLFSLMLQDNFTLTHHPLITSTFIASYWETIDYVDFSPKEKKRVDVALFPQLEMFHDLQRAPQFSTLDPEDDFKIIVIMDVSPGFNFSGYYVHVVELLWCEIKVRRMVEHDKYVPT
jgi:hypothetical protein